MSDFYNLRDLFVKEGLFFSFFGLMSHRLMENMGDNLLIQMDNNNIDKSKQRQIFSIFIEKIQNIINYSVNDIWEDGKNSKMADGMIMIGSKDDKCFVVGVNKVENKNIVIIKDKIDHINSLNKEDLKKLYKEIRRNGPTTENSKGAGIGFIEIARKSTLPLEYSFKQMDKTYSYFLLKTNI